MSRQGDLFQVFGPWLEMAGRGRTRKWPEQRTLGLDAVISDVGFPQGHKPTIRAWFTAPIPSGKLT